MAAVLGQILMISKFIMKPKPEKFSEGNFKAKRAIILSESTSVLPMSNYQKMKIGFDGKIVLDFVFCNVGFLKPFFVKRDRSLQFLDYHSEKCLNSPF